MKQAIQKKLLPNTLKLLEILFFINILFALGIIFFKLNVQQVDLAGHLASAVSTLRGYYHHYNPSIFLGYVHGLFYPPLEDFILAGILKLSTTQPLSQAILGFKFYLMCIWVLYSLSLLSLIQSFKKIETRIFLFTCFLWILNMEKPGLLHFQGMSFQDLWQTGLCSQILGGIFFFLLIRLIHLKTHSFWRWFLVFLGLILSHLVVALIAAFYCIVHFGLTFRDKSQRGKLLKIIAAAFLSLLLTSFFWVPFLRYGSYMTSSHVPSYNLKAISLLGIALLFFYKLLRSETLVLATSSLSILLCIEWFLFTKGFQTPTLHYYRFEIFVLIGFCLSCAVLLEKYPTTLRNLLLPMGFILFLFLEFKPLHYDFSQPRLQATQLGDLENRAEEVTKLFQGRTLTVDYERTVDFGLDSLLWINDESYRSVKGLYWESTRTNNLLSSYLASILSPPVVLDYIYLYDYSCEQRMCILDHFIWDFGIENLTLVENKPLSYLKEESQQCWNRIKKDQHTIFHKLQKSGNFSFNRNQYQVYKILPLVKGKSPPLHSTFPKESVETITSKNWYYSVLLQRSRSCEKLQRDSVLWSFEPVPKNLMMKKLTLQSYLPDKYKQSPSQSVRGINFVIE